MSYQPSGSLQYCHEKLHAIKSLTQCYPIQFDGVYSVTGWDVYLVNAGNIVVKDASLLRSDEFGTILTDR